MSEQRTINIRITAKGRMAGELRISTSLILLDRIASAAPPAPRTRHRIMMDTKSNRSALWRRMSRRKTIRERINAQKQDQKYM